jgi:hypothetical protein
MFELQSALFGSWFSCKFENTLLSKILPCLTSITVGLPAVFWLHMNQGQYFRDWKKTVLTITNVLIFLISCVIVSSTRLHSFHNPPSHPPFVKLTLRSVDWVFTCQALPSTAIRAPTAGPVLIAPDKQPKALYLGIEVADVVLDGIRRRQG